MMFRGGNAFQWRVSIIPVWGLGKSDFDDRVGDGSFITTQESKRWSLGAVVAPVWMLSSFGKFAVLAGPLGGYTYQKDRSENRDPDETSVSESTINRFHFGATMGMGFVPSSRIMITAEYQLTGSWMFRRRDLSGDSAFYEEESSDLGVNAVLTLAVRL